MIHLALFLAGVALLNLFKFFPYFVSISTLTISSFLLSRKKFLPVILIALGVFYAHMRTLPASDYGRGYNVRKVEGIFTEQASKTEKGFMQAFDTKEGSESVFSHREFEIGKEYALKVKEVREKKRQNPGERAGRPFLVLQGVEQEGGLADSMLIRINRMRESLNRHIKESLSPDSAGFILSVTTGHRADISRALNQAFNASGCAHLLSISGTHFGIFSLLLFGLFRHGVRSLPIGMLEKVTIYLTPSQAAVLLTLPFMMFYYLISGASIPSTRSFVMVSLFLLGILAGRKGMWLNFLLLAAVILVLWDPEVLKSISFQLSFIAVLFIGMGFSGKDNYQPGEKHGSRIAEYIKNSFLITFFASLGVSPLVAYYFHYSSLISPVANLIVTPIVCFLMVPVSLAGSFLYLISGHFILESAAGWLSGFSINLVRAFAAIPYASVSVPEFPPALIVFYYAGFILFWTLKRRSMLMVSFLPFIIFAAYSISISKSSSVTYLSVGRADSAVIELSDKKVLVVDTGYNGRQLQDYLKLKGIKKIDAIILTHGHPDHAGGLKRIIREFRVLEIWDNGRMKYPKGMIKGDIALRHLVRGDIINGKGFRVIALHPHDGFYSAANMDTETEENNESLVFKVELGDASFLFTSDTEAEALNDMASLGFNLKSDVLKIPHHGQSPGFDREFIKSVLPKTAIVSGYRIDRDIESSLKDANVLITGKVGAIKISSSGSGLKIKSFRDYYELTRTRNLKEEMENIIKLFTVW